jgi:hypothetical protein
MFVHFIHRYRKAKIDCLRFVMCPLLAQFKICFFSSFSAAAVYSTNEANKAGLKQSIIFRCLWFYFGIFSNKCNLLGGAFSMTVSTTILPFLKSQQLKEIKRNKEQIVSLGCKKCVAIKRGWSYKACLVSIWSVMKVKSFQR